jgi:hypothetical protein
VTEPRPARELFAQAVTAIWSYKSVRVLLLILFALEIYNNALLPAVQGTYALQKLKAETCVARQKSILAFQHMEEDLETGPTTQALMKLERECAEYRPTQPNEHEVPVKPKKPSPF